MSTKDLFNKNNKALTKSQEEKIKKDLESPDLAADVVRSNNKFHSHIDFSSPENFSFYGSAQKYYEDSFNRIYQTYPYDGSQSEKEKWFYDSSELDLWVLDNAYPKSTGYVRLGANQSIFVKGGPNKEPSVIEGEKEELSKQFPAKQGNSNIWDTSIYRNSNLYLDTSLGCTIEFWMKFDNPELSNITPLVIGNAGGERLNIRSFGNNSGVLNIAFFDDAFSGGANFNVTGLNNFFETTWNHYSFSFINSEDKIKTEIYKNGVLISDTLNGTSIGTISQEKLYLNINGSMNGINGSRTNVIDGMYVDEFRFWKRKRTTEEIGRYWHTHINGGTNTDDNKYNTENRKVDIGVYYKFNEGITGDSDIDSTVLDYSGRISNGEIIKYNSSVRNTGSAFNESGFFEVTEEKEPIIYSAHPDFVSTKEAYMQEGLTYDYTNNSSIYHTMPAWIIEEDEEKGENVKELSQVISSYFDSAQIKIKELVNLKDVEYHTLEERTNKPYSLIRRTLESAGMVVPDLFTEASAFEEILSRGEQEKFEEKLQDVKNTIYQNIYNNLSYIYKSKGTEKAFRNLIRCFGIDDELVKINLYSDGADYTLEDTRRTTAIKKKFIDFNDSMRDQGLVYTKEDPNNPKSSSYIRGVPNDLNVNLSFTFQTEIIFPKKVQSDHPSSQPQTNTKENIAFVGNYIGDYTGGEIFSVVAKKELDHPDSDNVKFVLNFQGQTVETEYFSSVYENSKWNIAVRLVPKKTISTIVDGTAMPDYRAELYCVRMLADLVEEEALLTIDIDKDLAKSILEKDKFVSIGAKSTTGNPEDATDNNSTRIKMSSTLFWYDNVTNEEIKAHASDASNFGRLRPSEEAYLTDGQINPPSISRKAIQVPRRDTLAMHWDFSEVTTTDNNGQFIVNDLSSDITATTQIINQNAIRYPSSGDAIDLGDISDFTFNDGNGTDKPFSFSTWVFSTDYVAEDGVFVSKRNNAASTSEYFFGNSNAEIQAFLYADPAQNNIGSFNTLNRIAVSSGNVLQNNTWHHITITYDGTQNLSGLKLFLDGSELNPANSSKTSYSGMPDSTSKTYLGGTQSPASNNFEGLMADTVFYNKALTNNEILEIYNGGKIKDIAEFSDYGSVISWYKMGDDLDQQGQGGILDYVSNNHGTLVNGASIQTATGLETDKIIKGRYGWFTELVGYEVTGRGLHFDSDDAQVVNREFVYSAKHRPPEVINSEDLIEIRQQDDVAFTKDAQVVSHFFAAEKSMYQVISDDMINLFATIVEFNNLIGQPVNRYRLQYKSLEKFRARYFEKVKNVPSLEKYIELYKWIDSSIGLMIQELIPVSSNFSADLRNMVESHVLERNKYWTKFPTMEMAGEPPLGIVKGINELTYNWEHGHAPAGTETIEDDKFLWGDVRAKATNTSVSTGNSDIDDNREILRRVSTRTTEGMVRVVDRGVAPVKNFVEEDKPFLRESPVAQGVPGAVYSGQAYVTRALSRPYKLNLDFSPTVHGGVNYSPTTKDPNAFVRTATRIIPGTGTVGLDVDLVDNTPTYEQWKELYTVKRSVTVTIADTDINFTENYDGDVIYPYYGEDFRDPSAFITGHHNDSYGDDAEIPMQGPFTETWVGGNQHRHVEPLVYGSYYYGEFNGSTGVTVGDNNLLSFDDDEGFSLSLTFKASSLNTYNGAIANFKTLVSKSLEYYVFIWDNAIVFYFQNSQDTMISEYLVDFNVGTWYDIIFSYDGESGLILYVNGKEVSLNLGDPALQGSLPNTNNNFVIGSTIGASGSEFEGLLRDVLLIDGAMTNLEIKELYSKGPENHSRYNDYIGWWRLREDEQSEVNSSQFTASSTGVNYFDFGLIRPELYVDDNGVLKHPHEVDSILPHARYTRDEVAKRPVNIRNIKTGESRLLGNYARDYEVVQTSSRTKNNRWFVRNEGELTETYTESPYISGAVDFELPDRGRTEHVIVERFSAPGDPLTLSRGYLDRIAEEFSVYNSMNYRNFDDREGHRQNLTAHSDFYEGSQGYVEGTNGLANIHKINRNTSHLPTGKNYDNAFISHQIPRSDFQYNVEMLSEERKFYDFQNIGQSTANFNLGRIVVPDNNDLSFTNGTDDFSFAVSLWVYIDSFQGSYSRLFGKYTGTNSDKEYSSFIHSNGDIRLAVYNNSSGTPSYTFNSPTGTISLNQWYHIVFDYSTVNDTMTFWVNGQSVGTEQESGTYEQMINTSSDFIIGQSNISQGAQFDFEGKMKDFVIFNSKANGVPMLSADDVTQLYNNNIENHSRYSDIVAWWKLDKDAKSSINSPALDGTATNVSFDGTFLASPDFSSANIVSSGANSFLQTPTTTSTIDDPPAGTGFDFKVIEYNNPIISKATISFSLYEHPLNISGEHLYFQYKLAEGNWTTLNIFQQGTGYSLDGYLHQETIDLGQDINSPIYLRWVSRVAQSNGNGIWGLDNISTSQVSFQKYPEHAEIKKGSGIYADYQGAGFRFVKNVENSQVVMQRKNNIYSQLDRSLRNGNQDRSINSFVEPAVSWNKPNTHFILNEKYDGFVRSGDENPTQNADAQELLNRRNNIRISSNPITYSYSNNLEMFANEGLTNAINKGSVQKAQFAYSLYVLLKRADLLFSRAISRELIFPKHKNIGLRKTRNRSYYDSYKIFWRDSMLDRVKCLNSTKLGYELTKEQVSLYGQAYSVDVMDNFFYKQTPAESGAIFSGTSSINIANPTIDFSFADQLNASTGTEGENSFAISLWIKPNAENPSDDQILFSKSGGYSSEGSTYTGKEYSFTLKSDGSLEFIQSHGFGFTPNSNTYATVANVIDPQSNQYHNIVIFYDAGAATATNALGKMFFYVDGVFISDSEKLDASSAFRRTAFPFMIGNEDDNYNDLVQNPDSEGFQGIMKNFVIFNFNNNTESFTQNDVTELFSENIINHPKSSDIVAWWSLVDSAVATIGGSSLNGIPVNVPFSVKYSVIGDLTYIGKDRITNTITRTDVPSLVQSQVLNIPHLEGKCASEVDTSYKSLYPYEVEQDSSSIPSPQLYHNPYNEEYKESQGWINKKVQLTGTSPADDTYDSFSEDIRLAAQEYGLVSEFRISEHMDKYLLENSGNFRVKNYDFLTLEGANYKGNIENVHTQTSKKTVEEFVSTFYSVKKELDSSEVKLYPTSSSDDTLVKNNSSNFLELNPVYSPSTSTFDISNSENTSFEISQTIRTNYTSDLPYQNGINALGLFNLEENDNDFVVVEMNNVLGDGEITSLKTQLNISPKDYNESPSTSGYPNPFTVSLWAKLDENRDLVGDYGLWSAGDSSGISMNLYANRNINTSGFGLVSFQNVGLTFGINDPSQPDLINQYVFYKRKEGAAFNERALLEEGKLNHIVFQFIPPEPTAALNSLYKMNYLIKLWLNGEELFGVPHRFASDGDYYTSKYQPAYSPCPLGKVQRPNPDWGTTQDIELYPHDPAITLPLTGCEDLNGIARLENFVIGNCDYQTSLASGDPDDKFVGAIDEFVILNGILPSSSIKSLYNNGKPSNINELAINKQIVGNLLTESSSGIFNGVTVGDNCEFDIGYKYYNSFDSLQPNSSPPGWSGTGFKVVEATDNSNKILALAGNVISASSVEDPPADMVLLPQEIEAGANLGDCRVAELDQYFTSSIDIEFRVYLGTGANNDLYGLDDPNNIDEVLLLQCEFDDSGEWDTVKTIAPFSEEQRKDLSQVVSASIDNPTGRKIKIRFFCFADNNLDEWGIDNLGIFRRNRIDLTSLTTTPTPSELKNDYIEIPHIDFSEENYSVSRQKETRLTTPVWHRIGVPQYTVSKNYDTWDEEFFNSYVHTDNINFIQKDKKSHASLGLDTKEVFRLKVNAIKKLLPYDGFYPQDRTVQLADLFVQKLNPDIIHGDKISKEQAIQAAMQHFFAPGILYNSIKAGIACDWASYTNNSGLEPSYYGQKFNVIDASGSFTQKYIEDAQPFWYTLDIILDEGRTAEESFRVGSVPSSDKWFLGLDGLPMKKANFHNFALMTEGQITDNSQTTGEVIFKLQAKQLIVTKEPNKRLPFEALLDPISFLQDGSDEQAYALSGTDYSVIRKPNQHYLMNPSYYTNFSKYELSFSGSSVTLLNEGDYDKYNYPYFEIKKTQENASDARYQMAMHNFLSETVRFFVKDQTLSSFASQPESRFKVMSPGTTYYMDVVLSKTDGFSPVYSPGSLGGRYFGPPAAYIYPRTYIDEQDQQFTGPISEDDFTPMFGTNKDYIKDPAYAMYTPPYFYGESIVRISFTPNDGERVYSLEEIFTKAKGTTEAINPQIDDLFYNTALEVTAGVKGLAEQKNQPGFDGFYNRSAAYKGRMPLSSSIELFGKTSLMRQEFNTQGDARSITSANGTELDTWVIYSKFECPLFDFSKESLKRNDLEDIGISKQYSERQNHGLFAYEASHLDADNNSAFLDDPMVGTGIWASHGSQQQSASSSGVTVSIRESFEKGQNPNAGSLIDVCGFAPSQQDIGRVADSKEVSEAVVMIPFLDRPLRISIPGIDRNRVAYETIQVDDRHFIKINPGIYAEQKRKVLNSDNSFYLDENGETVTETSISRIVKCMQKYNMPPRFDFETYETEPFAMYFFEFNHTFDKEDLTNIWQGLKPKLADKAILDSVEISHDINPNEIFGNLDEIPKDVRWMVFKVKKKAEKNYFRLTEDSRDDERFKFKFDVGTKEPEYGYNYPYDYFTMLELVQVEANSEKIVDPMEQYQKLGGDED